MAAEIELLLQEIIALVESILLLFVPIWFSAWVLKKILYACLSWMKRG